MDGIVNANQLTIVKEYEYDKPPIQKIDPLIDNSIRDCHHKCFHTIDQICEYDLNFTNIVNNETVNFTVSDKCMGMYELNKKLAIARERGFKFNQINKLIIKINSNLQSINICYYLKHRIPMCHRLFFRRISQSKEYIENFCNDINNPFQFECRKWYSYNNPQCNTV